MENKTGSTWREKYIKPSYVLGVLITPIVILSVLATRSPQTNSTTTQQPIPQENAPQVSSPQPSASTTSTESDGTGLVRKTVSGVVRTSVINFNKVMGIDQQTIIFGGDADAIDD